MFDAATLLKTEITNAIEQSNASFYTLTVDEDGYWLTRKRDNASIVADGFECRYKKDQEDEWNYDNCQAAASALNETGALIIKTYDAVNGTWKVPYAIGKTIFDMLPK